MFPKIDHIELFVKNLEKSVKFFTNELGFKVVGIEMYPESKGIQLQAGDVNLTLFERDTPGLNHIAFAVDDIDKTYEELKEKGVEFTVKPRLNPETGRILAMFKDVDGQDWQLAKKVQEALASERA